MPDPIKIAKRLFKSNSSLKEVDKLDLSEGDKSAVHNEMKRLMKDDIQAKNKKKWEKLANDNSYKME